MSFEDRNDDPRLTAYALGETEHLTARELAEIEELLAADPAVRAYVDELRAFGDELTAEFAGEPGPALTDAHRAAIAAAAPFSGSGPAPGIVGTVLHMPPVWLRAGVAAAALAAIGLMWASNMPRERETAAFEDGRRQYVDGFALTQPEELVAAVGDPIDFREHPDSVTRSRESVRYRDEVEARSEATAPQSSAYVQGGGGGGGGAKTDPVKAADKGLEVVARGRAPGKMAPPEGGIGGGAGAGRGGSPPPVNPFEPRRDDPVRLVPQPRAGLKIVPTKKPTTAKKPTTTTPPVVRRHDRKSLGELNRHRLPFRLGKGGFEDDLVVTRTQEGAEGLALREVLSATGVELTAEMKAELPVLGKAIQEFDALRVKGFTSYRTGAGGTTGEQTILLGAQLAVADVVDNYAKVLTPESLTLLKQTLAVRTSRSAESGAESYQGTVDNPFRVPSTDPLSTFSIDVDTASYANARRFLNANQLPPREAVRIEELVNYFKYDYAEPTDDIPFSVNLEVAACPWNTSNRLVRIGLRGKSVQTETQAPSNLVFLLDVSGSMKDANKLPLLKRSMKMLVQQMREQDTVGIVVYSGESKVALESTAGSNRAAIHGAIDALSAGGSTNGGAGIQDAYAMAERYLQSEGVNRVVLATDGDFNVGVTDRGALVDLVREKAKKNVFLTVLGFGTGNLKDATLEQIADKGNGNYHYVDSLREGRRVLVEEMHGTLVTIAKDVKLQVEFNPSVVASYRLVGYANRLLAARDFNDDTKDAGEIGAGHTVTALYEVVPVGTPDGTPAVDPLKYQEQPKPKPAGSNASREMLTVKLRYKQPDGDKSSKVEVALTDPGGTYGNASRDFKFAAGVASFGMLLRASPYKGTASYEAVLELAGEGVGDDPRGYRTEFLDLVRKAQALTSGR